MKIPQDVIDHCNSHPLCKGCPLKTCVAPLTGITDVKWGEWVGERINAVRGLSA